MNLYQIFFSIVVVRVSGNLIFNSTESLSGYKVWFYSFLSGSMKKSVTFEKKYYFCAMKKVEEILEKILLPIDSSWNIVEVKVDEPQESIEIELNYGKPYIEEGGKRYSIYDHRPIRHWRHLDLWQYKTYISARLPRYKDSSGFYHTLSIPWADSGEQMTDLLEKKNNNNFAKDKESE